PGNRDGLGGGTSEAKARDSTRITDTLTFASEYRAVLDSIGRTGTRGGVLIGVANVTLIPYFSKGSKFFKVKAGTDSIAGPDSASRRFPANFLVAPSCAPPHGDSVLVPFPSGAAVLAFARANPSIPVGVTCGDYDAGRRVLQSPRRPPERDVAQAGRQRAHRLHQHAVRIPSPGDPLTRTLPDTWGNGNGTRRPPGAVLLMRPILAFGLAVAALPALARGVGAQAVERTDTPRRGTVRLTFDPQTMVWDAAFTPQGRRPLGWALTGDTVGAAAGPTLAHLEQDVRTASGLSGFVASLGRTLLAVHAERRVTPIGLEVGVTDRLSFGAMVPLVRVQTRARLSLNAAGANRGGNPRWTTAGADPSYAAFFMHFDTALAHLDDSLAVWCPSNPQCAPATALSTRGHAVRLALGHSVYGVGGEPATFLPVDTSDGGQAIDSTLLRLQTDLA